MQRKIRGEFMLMITALIWGVSFVAQRSGMEYIGPFTFNGIRCFIGALVLIPVIIIMDRQRKIRQSTESEIKTTEIEKKAAKKNLIAGGLSCGIVFFISSSVQQIGMVYTTAGKAGFITALYIVIVPILGIFLKKKVRPILWFCVVLATAGLYLLCIKEGFSIGKGDLLVVICAFGFSIHILVIDHFSPKVDGVKLSCFQFLICGILSIPFMIIFETINWTNIMNCWLPIIYAGVMSCGVAYTLQVIAQKYTEPTVTSLILCLESVFAVIAGIIILNEQISMRETFGCIIMFAAILLAQIPAKSKETNKISETNEKIDKGEDLEWQNL
ncbi:DMT family transporter [Sinanaerobacter chloroacetimidivorans]|uniref:DMT family transporter n=1 Tax=Sinanaerobacter chloroacetimidivorans TaxID=2818044 RepID=A0A8J7W581_9FIRM|nr:DMT family transporter [Sinanaerobacter chloroacetimidivorans]MBR0599415.1 DMT family transporter [Sinanaerobacter chloroacetimidivorans]